MPSHLPNAAPPIPPLHLPPTWSASTTRKPFRRPSASAPSLSITLGPGAGAGAGAGQDARYLRRTGRCSGPGTRRGAQLPTKQRRPQLAAPLKSPHCVRPTCCSLSHRPTTVPWRAGANSTPAPFGLPLSPASTQRQPHLRTLPRPQAIEGHSRHHTTTTTTTTQLSTRIRYFSTFCNLSRLQPLPPHLSMYAPRLWNVMAATPPAAISTGMCRPLDAAAAASRSLSSRAAFGRRGQRGQSVGHSWAARRVARGRTRAATTRAVRTSRPSHAASMRAGREQYRHVHTEAQFRACYLVCEGDCQDAAGVGGAWPRDQVQRAGHHHTRLAAARARLGGTVRGYSNGGFVDSVHLIGAVRVGEGKGRGRGCTNGKVGGSWQGSGRTL